MSNQAPQPEKPKMKSENAIIAVVAVGVLAFVGGRMTSKPATPEPAAAEAVKVEAPAAVAAAANVPSIGPDDAKVTIIEISDFQCPFCSRAYNTLEELRKQYPKDLRVVFVNQPLPFHQNAKPSAIAAMAAHKQGKFWDMYGKLFTNQQQLSDENYKKWAKEIGLDMAKFDADLKDPALAKAVDRDQAVANALGVRGTPGFFVNGVNISGAQPIENFKKVIDEQIQKANDAIGKGAKGPELMAKLTRDANPSQGDQILKYVFGGENPPADAAPANQPPPKPREDPTADMTVWKVALNGQEPAKGKADALVTLVWFTDFQCPFCSRVQPTIEQLEKDYGDKLRIVFKNLPLDFHKLAMGAAEASLCAHEQGKFWEMEKHLYENQQQLEPAQLTEQAKAVGLDAGKFQACMDAHKTKDAIAKDMATAEKIKATGTPAFFINGRKLSGARPVEDFKKMIDQELAKAEAAVKGGTAPAKLYDSIVANGKEEVPPPPLDAKVNNFDYAGSPHFGPKDAKVKIVEFKDFQCPFCAKVIPTLKAVEQKHHGKVAIVYKHYPLSSQCNPDMPRDMHPAACLATYWSMAAEEQGKFWEFEELVYNNFSTMMPQEGELEARKAAQTENLKKFAKEVGMDVAKAEAYVNAKKYEPRLKKDLEEAKAAGVRGTPSMYINGRQHQGPMSPDKMGELVQKLLDGKL
jgi:protein-disulfide isomerase